MNSDQVLGILRSILAAAGGWAVGKGYIDSDTATALAGAIVTIAIAGWSFYTNSKSAMIKSVNNADNGVKVVDANAPAPTVNESLK
jgi:hypothetical protein